MTSATTASVPASNAPSNQLDLQALEEAISTSVPFGWAVALGLPSLGVIAAFWVQLPLFATLLAGGFLFATGLTIHRAVTTFVGKTLRLLVMARLAIMTVLASLLLITTGAVWMTLVSATLIWLVADRLMGRRALYDLWKLTRSRP